jgi:co-chaperonin GroES (HSP10)
MHLMLKRIALTIILVAFTAASALAAPLTGKIAAIAGDKVEITLTLTDEKPPSWIKKGAPVKFTKGGTGKIVGVGEGSITVQTPKAADMKAGDAVSFDKGRASSGC